MVSFGLFANCKRTILLGCHHPLVFTAIAANSLGSRSIQSDGYPKKTQTESVFRPSLNSGWKFKVQKNVPGVPIGFFVGYCRWEASSPKKCYRFFWSCEVTLICSSPKKNRRNFQVIKSKVEKNTWKNVSKVEVSSESSGFQVMRKGLHSIRFE